MKLYKNNTDFRGHSYGCHDNYLIPRVIPWDRLVHAMTPFLVTRQLYAGAGKVGWECENNGGAGGFQISQRADFFSELVSIDTMNRRPLINTRDEPHADPTRFRRFHVIIGDSNLSQFATWLKIGTTALMLESLEHEGAPDWWSLADPLEAHRHISRDEIVPVGRPAGQRQDHPRGRSPVRIHPLGREAGRSGAPGKARRCSPTGRRPSQTLEKRSALAPRPARLGGQAPAARRLPRAGKSRSGTARGCRASISNITCSSTTRAFSSRWKIRAQMKQLIGEAEIIHAVQHPPASSRAYLRGRSVLKFAREMKTAQWDNLVFKVGDQMYRLDMSQAFPGLRLEEMIAAMDKSKTIHDLIRELNLKPV